MVLWEDIFKFSTSQKPTNCFRYKQILVESCAFTCKNSYLEFFLLDSLLTKISLGQKYKN